MIMHGYWGFPWMGIFPLIIFALVLFFVLRNIDSFPCAHRKINTKDHNTQLQNAREMLDIRYARGEITRDEYLQIKKDIE